MTQVGEIAPHLGSVDTYGSGDLLRGDRCPPVLVKSLEVAGEAAHRGAGNVAHDPFLRKDRDQEIGRGRGGVKRRLLAGLRAVSELPGIR